MSRNGIVTGSSQAAVDAGLSVLGLGGNAVDAAVATALASCVADPCNTGLGGYGGYIVVQRRDLDARCVQFPLWAPSTMSPAELARPYPEQGPACSAVPNVVGGLARALAEFGRLTWGVVSQPAIALARDGVTANGTTLRAFAAHRQRPFVAECFELEEIDRDGKQSLIFRQPVLAATLETMATHGPQWFYSGPLGDAACRAWDEAGIDVPLGDWRSEAEAVDVVKAARHQIDGVLIDSAPLGLSGSACLFGTLTAAHRVSKRRPLSDPAALVELATLMATMWQYRFGAPGGNDFGEGDVARWVETALGGRGEGSDEKLPAAGHTTHLNAADADGTLVAATITHGPAWFGGRWAIPGTGVIMNGGMHNFSRPVLVRRNGRHYGVSNMAPSVAAGVTGGRVAIGSPGARRIPSNVGLAVARHAFAGMGLQEAVSAGRIHAESRDRVTFEISRLGSGIGSSLKQEFADVDEENWQDYFGPLTAIRANAEGRYEAAVDDREIPGFAAAT
jgi:gamma-glutamyltranspeptidase / glutathione hydrolase